MERELVSKIFILEKYNSKENMEEDIKEYVNKLKSDYPKAVVTREFYRGQNILVRATEFDDKLNNRESIRQKEREDDWYIRQRGER
ncbi:MAG: hypothetical protein ACI4VH_05375 [Clostridia bacterium]